MTGDSTYCRFLVFHARRNQPRVTDQPLIKIANQVHGILIEVVKVLINTCLLHYENLGAKL
jgi:hypothetical protein